MKSIFLCLIALICVTIPAAYSGKAELTTYYPAPYGEYKQLKVNGSDALNSTIALEARGNTGTGLVVTNANNVGIGTASPIADLDVLSAPRSGTHPGAVPGLYVTGNFGPSSNGVEFRHSNGTQGIGFGYNTIYAAGSNADQSLNLMPKGTSGVGIGTTAPGAKLDVSGGALIDGLTVGKGPGSLANTVVGREALLSNTTGYGNTALGEWALYLNSTGRDNLAVGPSALRNNTTGSNNLAIGGNALERNTGGHNLAMGMNALVRPSGAYNLAIGENALIGNTSGWYNVAVGYNSGGSTTGQYNTAIGNEAGQGNNLGSNNTFVGNGAVGLDLTESNSVVLGNGAILKLRCAKTSLTNLSDARDKKDIVPLPFGLNLISLLKPVAFTWNTRDGAKVGIRDSGFIAQDLKAAQDAVGAAATLDLVDETNPDRLEATPGNLLPVLVKAIQEQQKEIEELKAKLDLK